MAAPAPLPRPREYLLVGNYGTFEVSKVLIVQGEIGWDEDDYEDHVWCETGIRTTLEEDGWEVEGPTGEEWQVDQL